MSGTNGKGTPLFIRGRSQSVKIDGPLIGATGTSAGRLALIPDHSNITNRGPSNFNFFGETGEGIRLPSGSTYSVSITFTTTNDLEPAVAFCNMPVYLYVNGFLSEGFVDGLLGVMAARSSELGGSNTSFAYTIDANLGDDTRVFFGSTFNNLSNNFDFFVGISEIL